MESNKQFVVVEPQADFQHIEYVIVLRYQPAAQAVEERASTDEGISFTPLDSPVPVPTVQIGSDFYQLAPTPTPSPNARSDRDRGRGRAGGARDPGAHRVHPRTRRELRVPGARRGGHGHELRIYPAADGHAQPHAAAAGPVGGGGTKRC